MLLIGAVAALLPFGWRWWVQSQTVNDIYTLEEAPSQRVAIVFGARVYPSGRLSGMLRDRVDTAVALYQQGKVDKLLFSGDNRFEDYDEPGAMMAHAMARGVPQVAIQPDYGGRRTYDTCYRAREVFSLRPRS